MGSWQDLGSPPQGLTEGPGGEADGPKVGALPFPMGPVWGGEIVSPRLSTLSWETPVNLSLEVPPRGHPGSWHQNAQSSF